VARPGDAAIDTARWERIQQLFHAAAELPAAARVAFLVQECRGDGAMLASITAMLEEDARAGSLLDHDVARAAERVLGSASPDLPPDQFGPYRLREVLGEGGMGVVYLAGREDLGSVAAIKILRDAWLSPARRERFASEQRTLAQLNHPSIARLYDADTLADGTPWFAMEYVEGVPLTTYCSTHQLGMAERLRLFRAVCEAVQHAHQHLVVHRDLKPSNILVTPEGAIKLLDFGIAKQVEHVDRTADHTRTGLRLMTPAYAAPEQITGGRIGVHTDVYALGVVLYELLTERLPLDLSGLTPGQVETAIVEREPERPSARARQSVAAPAAGKAAWADLDVLCLTAMHKDPARRYQTVEALVRDVDHFLAGEPLDARPDAMGYRLGKFVRRNSARVAAAATALAVVIGLVIFYTARVTGARNVALAEAARAQRIQRFTMTLFEGGDKEVGPADSLRVVTLLDKGLLEARAMVAEPAVQAELYETLGSIYQKLGALTRADTLLQAALEARRALFPPGNPAVTGSLISLGLLRMEEARFEDAEKLVREALDQSRLALPERHPAIAQATAALGRVLQEKGTYEPAIAAGEAAVRLYSASGDSLTPELAATLSELAGSHFYAGHYETADSLNQIVLGMYRHLYGERHPLVAQVLINLGASQFDRGRYAEAEKYDREGLQVFQAFYGRDHHETAYAMTMLGRALVAKKEFPEAVGLLQQALAIRERVYGPVHPVVASTLNELGNTALARDDLDAAESSFSRMVDIYRKAYNDKHYLIGIAMSNLASVYVQRRDYVKAERLYREVMARYVGVLEPDHINVGITRIKLGRALLRQKRWAEAAAESNAGYDILSKQSDPAVGFLRAARIDLTIAYTQLHQPDKSKKFFAEITDSAGKALARTRPQ
jgi:eukaryotic-like serine/threonine-protein kinase